MTSTNSIFKPASIVNLGTLVGIAAGLAVGLLGASALFPETTTISTISPGTTIALSPRQQEFVAFRVSLVSEGDVLGETLRLITNKQDHRPAAAALARQRNTTAASMEKLFTKGVAQDVIRARTAMAEAMIAYAGKITLGEENPSAVLTNLDNHIDVAAQSLASTNEALAAPLIRNFLVRERDNFKAIVDLSSSAKIAESFTRQQQAQAAEVGLVHLLNR